MDCQQILKMGSEVITELKRRNGVEYHEAVREAIVILLENGRCFNSDAGKKLVEEIERLLEEQREKLQLLTKGL